MRCRGLTSPPPPGFRSEIEDKIAKERQERNNAASLRESEMKQDAEAALAKFHADRKASNEASQAKNLCAPYLLAQRPLSALPACANGRRLNCHKRGFLLGRSDASFCVAGLQGG
eukprot:COSAG04_NODE_4356_length_2140_cov_1.458599_4_plen_115_part_00